MKLHTHDGSNFFFYCPGCKAGHHYVTGQGRWTFNGNLESPTFTPSLRLYTHAILPNEDWPNGRAEETVCHLFVRNGQIEFCGDCNHDLKGKTVPMLDFPKGYGLPGLENGAP